MKVLFHQPTINLFGINKMINIIKEYLPISEYYREQTVKKRIVLHHTVASNKDSSISWWKKDGIHVAVSYIIDKDGGIYELFDPSFWSYHLGPPTLAYDNKTAIGIEIVNEGQLYKRSDGNYYWWINKDNPLGKVKYNGNVFDNNIEWRGYRYWASYTNEQINSVILLLKHLTQTLNINSDVITTYEYDKSLLNFNGIISHHNVRKDKTDVSPALNLSFIQSSLLDNDNIENENVLANINTTDTKTETTWIPILWLLDLIKQLKTKLT